MCRKQFGDRHLREWRDAEHLKNFVQTRLQLQSLLENGDEQVGADGGPDLDVHRVVRGADEPKIRS